MRKTKTARAERAAQFTDEERAARRARAEGLRKVARMWLDQTRAPRKDLRRIEQELQTAKKGLMSLRHPIQWRLLHRRIAVLRARMFFLRDLNSGMLRTILDEVELLHGGPTTASVLNFLLGHRPAWTSAPTEIYAGLARMTMSALADTFNRLRFLRDRGCDLSDQAMELFNGELYRREIALNGCDPDGGLPSADGRPVHHAERWADDVGIPTADVQIVTPKKRPTREPEAIAAARVDLWFASPVCGPPPASEPKLGGEPRPISEIVAAATQIGLVREPKP
jgi:hypothetical protein